MSKWFWLIISFFLITVGCIGAYIYQFAGFRYFLKSLKIIQKSSTELERISIWNEFKGPDPKWVYGGILAGSWMDRVWIWGARGIKSFSVDEYSVYSYFDGCNDKTMSLLSSGASGDVIEREIFTDLNTWRKKAIIGDYVRANLTRPDADGVVGNLRELYTYNFWLFMRAGMEERCAK